MFTHTDTAKGAKRNTYCYGLVNIGVCVWIIVYLESKFVIALKLSLNFEDLPCYSAEIR